jgi:hypothetical protein
MSRNRNSYLNVSLLFASEFGTHFCWRTENTNLCVILICEVLLQILGKLLCSFGLIPHSAPCLCWCIPLSCSAVTECYCDWSLLYIAQTRYCPTTCKKIILKILVSFRNGSFSEFHYFHVINALSSLGNKECLSVIKLSKIPADYRKYFLSLLPRLYNYSCLRQSATNFPVLLYIQKAPLRINEIKR